MSGPTLKHVVLTSGPTITEYTFSNPPHNGAHGIVVGPDGALWFCLPASNEIGRTTTSGTTTFYSLASGSTPESIAAGPDGNLWFTEWGSAKIGRITTSGTISEFSTGGVYPYGWPDRITAGPDGNLWFTLYQSPGNTGFNGTSYIGKITTSGAVTRYALSVAYAGAMGIAAGPDGNVWVTENTARYVARIAPATGADTEFSVGSSIGGSPADIVPGPGGQMWFAESNYSEIGSISLGGTTVQAHSLPSGDSAIGLAFDSSDDLWYADSGTSSIGEMGPGGTVSETATPTASAGPYGIVADARNSSLWFTENSIPGVATLAQPPFALLGAPLSQSELLGLYNGCLACSERYQTLHALHVDRGDPVNTVTGNFNEEVTDIAVAGRGIPLTFSRTYNSANSTANGPLGYGWSINWGASLSQPGGTGNVTIAQENGSTVTFVPAGSGWAPAAPRDVATLTHNNDGSWTFSRLSQDTLAFNATGQLTSETDRNGYTTTLQYSSGVLTKIVDPAGRSFTISYTAALITKVNDDQTGRNVQFAYNDGNGNLTDVTDVNGDNLHYTYDSNHFMTGLRDARGNSTTNVYDSQGRVTSQTDAMNRTTTFAYAGSGLSTSGGSTTITDPKGNVVLDQYVSGALVSQTKGYGTSQSSTWTYQYDPATLGLTAIIDPNGHETQLSYDSAGNVLASVDALGRWTTNTYNSFNEVLTTTDALGVTTTNTYDGHGNMTATSRPLVGSNPAQSAVTQYFYDDASHPGDMTRKIDPNGKTWSYAYDTYGNRTSVTDPLGDQSTQAFNADSWRTSSTSARGNVAGCNCAAQYTTTYSYQDPQTGQLNGFGDVRVATDPLGHATTYTYDANRNRTIVKDHLGNTDTFTFDADNEQTQDARPDGSRVKTDYNADGTVLDQIDGNGDKTSYGYDAQARLTSSTDPLNRTTNYTYDGAGNRLTAVSARNITTSYTYDAGNQLVGTSYSDGTTHSTSYSYDLDGQRVAMTDGSGNSSWTWDSLHRMTSYQNGAGQVVSYGYDLNGQQTSIQYPGSGQSVTRAFDAAGRLTSVADWLGHTTTFTPDPDSNVAAIAYPNGTTTSSTFDANDMTSSISAAPTATPNSPFASFSYTRDADSQISAVASSGVPADNHTDGYSPLNQLNKVDNTSYNYDSADNVNKLPTGAVYTHDAGSQLTSSSYSFNVSTGAAGDTGTGTSLTITLGSSTQANDVVLLSTTQVAGTTVTPPTGYTQVASVTSTGTPAATTIVYEHVAIAGERTIQVSYSAAVAKSATAAVFRGIDPSNPIDVSDTAAAAGATQVTMPSLTPSGAGDRLVLLTGSTANASASTWTASTFGSAVQKDQTQTSSAILQVTYVTNHATGTKTAVYGVSGNLAAVMVMLRPLNTTYQYDADGNRVTMTPPSGSPTTYGYDAADRLTSIGSTVTYSYDGDGLRTSKTVNGTVEPFTWDESGSLPMLLVDGSGTGATDYIYDGSGHVIEAISGSTVHFIVADQLGSTRAVTDINGSVTATYTYDSYGNMSGQTGTMSSALLYQGQFRDAESGFYYLRARYYDPNSAEFLSRDPAVATTRLPYAYAIDNPLSQSDPSGRDSFNTIPASAHYSGPTADCSLAESSGFNDYIVMNPNGESDVLRCAQAFPGGTAIPASSLQFPAWGDNGEATNGAVIPADVNHGANIEDPLIRDEPLPGPAEIAIACVGILVDVATDNEEMIPVWVHNIQVALGIGADAIGVADRLANANR